eukprot:TRINITY_DN871_c0_g1_i1.p1 TRINITY_DN871_c0_g1~~TRINITY_DN871_c0_g1_i1.p1  ORF type:complete len:248 (+),score=41.86 TRINITY_DN871_c0_g1_i1:78-821(+)
MHQTRKLYFDDSYSFKSKAKVSKVKVSEDLKKGKQVVILEETIFHPQGGGQPYDTGYISSDKAKFKVKDVREAAGIVEHYGEFEPETASFEEGEEVSLEINENDRKLYARIHSAGHALDVAVSATGLKLIPGKGFHFPSGPYVEYEGTIPNDQRKTFQARVQEELNKLILQSVPVTVNWVEYDKIKDVCGSVPSYLSKDKPSRIVTMASEACPCGGTHVKNLSELGKVTIKGIKTKKGNVRISYTVQ